MKEGRTLPELALEVKRISETKRDFVVDTRNVGFLTEPTKGTILTIRDGDTPSFGVNKLAHDQIAEYAGIPRTYYGRMQEKGPALLDMNVRHWLDEEPAPRMVRCLDGNVRAFLSNRYARRDNYDVMQVVMPELAKLGNLQVASCELTERRMYLKVIFLDRKAFIDEHQRGDEVCAGMVISNSEVGKGAFNIEDLLWRLSCKNGLITDSVMRRAHIGRPIELGEDRAMELSISAEAQEADDKAFLLLVRDLVRGWADNTRFDRIVGKMRDTKNIGLPHPQDTVELVKKRESLTDNEGADVIKYLIEGGDLNAFGLVNAITRMSQDVGDYERATELEKLGGKLVEMETKELRQLCELVR